MHDYDVIIIGAGIGGLTCGALLAKHGMNVLICEQHTKPGGYCTSYQRGEFRFEIPDQIGGLKRGSPVAEVFDYLGVSQDISFVAVERIFRSVYPDITVDCWVDRDRYRDELQRAFPQEARGIAKYFEESMRVWRQFTDSDLSPSPHHFLLAPFRFPDLVKVARMTYREQVCRHVRDERLRELLATGWRYMGLPATQASAVYMTAMYEQYHTGGAWFPVGGYQKLSDTLAARYVGLGGVLRLGVRAERIMLRGGVVAGVRAVDGSIISTQRVVSDADSKKTFQILLGEEHLNGRFRRRVSRMKMSTSAFSVHLGVKMDISQDFNCGCVNFCPSYGTTDTTSEICAREDTVADPRQVGFKLCSATFKDPLTAPVGCHSLKLSLMPAPYRYQDCWHRDDPEKYRQLKEEVAERLILNAEQLLPGLRGNVVVSDISTPLTFERYTGATEGAWYDAAAVPEQIGFGRLPVATPVSGLYLTGAKTYPGHGMFSTVMSGLFAADAVLSGKLVGGYRFPKPGWADGMSALGAS